MTYFLDRIASHLFDHFGDRLDRHCIVFPNRRAGLYFLRYLADRAGKPIWSPEVKTINELFQYFSARKVAESELLVFKLFRVYRELHKNAGSIDDFFFWGEMLINDFDDIDKYLVDANKLFVNLKEIKEIDEKFGGLTDSQIQIIKQFWINFNPTAPTDQKSYFQEIWSILLTLYEKFRFSLIDEGIAYEGMIYREVAENCIKGDLKQGRWDHIHFIGFNALNNCEKELMKYLKRLEYARFYWDYDDSFVSGNPGHSAGYFIKENLKQFGNHMPEDWNYNSASSLPGMLPVIKVIDSASDTAQVKLAAKIIGESSYLNDVNAHHTAIVLSDENLLLPALTSLPDKVENINVTMGYPLKYSPVYNLIKDLLTLQKTSGSNEAGDVVFDQREVNSILKNSFFTVNSENVSSFQFSELMTGKDLWISSSAFKGISPFDTIFRKIDTAKDLSIYLKTILENLYVLTKESDDKVPVAVGINMRNEFIYRVILAINRLDALLSDTGSSISFQTYARLIDRILKGLSIPFYGEPLNGIQIMGILETRCLDFRNLLILSVNEGILPQTSTSGSFVPFNLREAFGLPTIRHQDSIYAYYFYRLLQRAENITLMYNSGADGLKTGEISRFILQLKYGSGLPDFSSQRFEIMAPESVPHEIKRGVVHAEKLQKEFLSDDRKILSPSAVNSWLTCRMKFYYRYVCGLKEYDKVNREIDPSMFGELLHSVMEKIYSPYKKRTIDLEIFNSILKDENHISQLITDTIIEKFYNMKKRSLSGSDLIICNILKSYVLLIIKRDHDLAPLEIIELEYPISSDLEINILDKKEKIKIGGVIDRLDRSKGIYRVTDYKTGKTDMEIPSLESLFNEKEKNRNDSWFQIFMYCYVLLAAGSESSVHPSVYPVRNMYNEDFIDTLTIRDADGQNMLISNFGEVRELFGLHLANTIERIFDIEEPFRMTDNLKTCEDCPYARLCQR
jgi:CRISPR/Cas system-associated exonuclease Cas4 (RecB family)